MKHLALDFHFVHEKVQEGYIRVTHIKRGDQLAGVLTKPLLKTLLQQSSIQDWTILMIVRLARAY